MSVLEALSEEEQYLVSILQDASGIDLAEFLWKDPDQPDNLFRCYDYQYPWYRNDSKQQIDQCIAEGELVFTRRGQVPIEQVRIGDEVWTHRNRWRRVTWTWDKGVQEVVRVTNPGNNAGLLVTPDHRMWTRDGTRKMLAGVRTIHPTEPEFRAPQDFTPRLGEQYATMVASPWDFGCASEVPPVQRLPKCRRDTIPEITDEFLWLCGIYVAEGTVRSSGNETVLSVHRDEAELVAKMAVKVGLRPRTYDADTQVRQVILPGRSLGAWFIQHFGKLAYGKKLPNWALSMSAPARQALLDGLIYGDGYTRNTRRDSTRTSDAYTTVSKALAYDVRLLAQSLGRGASVSMARRAGVMQIMGRIVSTRDTYEVALYVQESKRSRIALIDEHIWAAHYGVVAAGLAHVYDIEVEEDHSFVANGQVQSNCARAVGKSVGIQMRAYAFPFCNPGNDMLITAPEMIHLDPVTKNIEDRLMSTRLSREMLKSGNQSSGITHRPFEAKFRNDAKIVGRIPQKDGKGVKGSCLFAGSVILTQRGLVLAEDLTMNDWVLTHRGHFRRITNIMRYETDVVKVAGAGHRGIIVSTNHRFYARRNSNPQRTRNLGTPRWVSVDDQELTERYYWGTPTQFPMKVDPPDFPVPSHMEMVPNTKGVEKWRPVEVPLSENGIPMLLSIAGSYVADGYVAGGRGNPHLGFVDDEAGIQRIEALAKLLGYSPRRLHHDNAVSAAIYNTNLATWLQTEFGKLAQGKTLPAWLLGASDQWKQAFLEAYLQGDGYWSEDKHRWEISTASKQLAIGIKLLAQSLGHSTSFSWVDPKVKSIAGIDLRAEPRRSYRVQINESGHGLIEDGVMWQKIRSVVPLGRREVFDLIVDEDHSYVADGIIHRGGLDEREVW